MVLISRSSNFETNIIFRYKTKFHFVSVANQSRLYKSHRILYMFLFEKDNKIISQCLISVVNTQWAWRNFFV